MAPGGGNELSDLTGDIPPAVSSIPQLLRRTPESETGLTAGEDTTSAIPIAPDIQPKPYTLITRPQPSELDGVLNTVLGLGKSMLGGGGSGGGSAASSSAADAAGSSASDISDSDFSDLMDFSGFAKGGLNGRVHGPGTGTSDSMLARFSNGEFITKASSTAKYLPLLKAINSDTLKFAGGGYVGFDDGGFVSPSAAYSPGERSWSTMSSASNQMAAANTSGSRSSSGDSHQWNIHIPPGANDPAQMTAAFDRHMRTAAPQIAALALHAVKDQQLRRAPSAR